MVCLWWGSVLLQAMPTDTVYNSSLYWASGQHEALPAWIFSPQGQGRVIAASDPCMLPEAARKQALQRALYLYSLQEGVTVRILSDVFSSMETVTGTFDDARNKILVFSSIQQRGKHYAYKIVNEYTSLFGECYLQVQVLTDGNMTLDNAICRSGCELMMLFTRERNEDREIKMVMNIETEQEDAIDQSSFELKGEPDDLQVLSVLNGAAIPAPHQSCWYESTLDEADQAQSEQMNHSFWSAYMASFLEQILFYPFDNVQVQHVEDNFDDDVMFQLQREKVASTASIVPHIKGVWKNRLLIDWQIFQQ